MNPCYWLLIVAGIAFLIGVAAFLLALRDVTLDDPVCKHGLPTEHICVDCRDEFLKRQKEFMARLTKKDKK